MPADEPSRSLQLAAVEVQIAAAECRRRDFQHAVCVVLQVRVGFVFDCDLVGALVDDCSHGGGGLEGGHGVSFVLCCCCVGVGVAIQFDFLLIMFLSFPGSWFFSKW